MRPEKWQIAAICRLVEAKGHRPLTFPSSLTFSKVCKVRQPVFDQRAW